MAILFLLLISVTCFFLVYIMMPSKEKVKEYKDNYDKALKDGNKVDALKWGRKYYESLRLDGNLTIYDEQAIQNDISAYCK